MEQIANIPEPIDLSSVIRTLRVALFGWVGRGPLTQAVMMLVHNRLGVICGRMERLMARFAAGTLLVRGPRARAVSAEIGGIETGAVGVRARPERIWPLEFGWLLKPLAHHAAVYTWRLEMVLREPEMVALLMAAPQAARLLRPLCRMLGVPTSLLRPGDVKQPVEPVVRKQRVRRKRAPSYTGRIPLPRGVLSACRRAGFYPDP